MVSDKPRVPHLRSSLFAGIVIVAVAIGGYAGWLLSLSHNPSAMTLAAAVVPVAIATAQQRDVPIYLTGLGTVKDFNTVTIRAPDRHFRSEDWRKKMELDPEFLSRLQFAFVISFHIIFPSFTIGLAAWLATIEGMRLGTGDADLSPGLRLLAEGLRPVLWHGCRNRYRDGFSVRHQLERALRAHRADPRPAARL